MKNCHEDMIAYHNDEVTLPEKEQNEMRERRNSNRQKLKSGLKRDNEPSPIGCRSQGSYAMRTMVQQADKDYDIDDGAYFEREKLKGPQGGDKSAAAAKEMVRKALHDDKFKRAPEVLKNCVRVYYDQGYHVDVPVYREVTETDFFGDDQKWYELASTDWKQSDPLSVTQWFKDENIKQSPDTENGGQLRRIVRLLKAFARSRPSWRERIATGFMITKLVVEKYVSNTEREDKSLYDTMVAIRNRLQFDTEIEHPTLSETITRGPDDGRTKFLRDKLDWAIDELEVVFKHDCTCEQALRAWDKVFNTEFFIGRLESQEASDEAAMATLLIKGKESKASEQPVDKHGGGRYA